MVSTRYLQIALPTAVLEEIGLDKAAQVRCLEKLSEPLLMPLEMVSPRYLEHSDPHKFDHMSALFGIKDNDQLNNDMEQAEEENKEEEEYLVSLEPRNWKSQDHYLVLGLQHLRYNATQEDIKQAYLKKALKHHPDKKAGQQKENKANSTLGEPADKERVFMCVQKAFDILSDPMKRQEFDSVDAAVEDTLLSMEEMRGWIEAGTWYERVREVLAREMRFAATPASVPELGDEDSTKEQVDHFYDAWYHFESWRRFDYLDKEEIQGENRDDKRYQEKKNKAERLKKLTVEKARLRTVIETIEESDPRMKLLKEKEKEMKKLSRQAKRQRGVPGGPSALPTQQQQAQQQKQLEELKKEQEARDLENLKKAKELQRQRALELKTEKKSLKQWITKTARYLVPENEELKSSQMEKVLMDVEKLLESQCKVLEMVQALKQSLLQAYDEGGIAKAREQFEAYVNGEQSIQPMTPSASAPLSTHEESTVPTLGKGKVKTEGVDIKKEEPRTARPWSSNELALLVKATNLYPGGTNARWEKIASYVAEHGHETKREIQEIIDQTKHLNPKHQTSALMKNIHAIQEDQAAVDLKKNKIEIHSEATLRDDHTASGKVEDAKAGVDHENEVWTSHQQMQLQSALKKYPNTYKDADRWDKIAEMVDGKDRRACIHRCKYLIEQLKLKEQQK